MIIIRVNLETGKIIGRSRSKTGDDCIEVEDSLWGRIAADPNAFEYNTETQSIELKESYVKSSKSSDQDAYDVAGYVKNILDKVYVPELEAHITLGGPLGSALLLALASVPYSPQTILCTDNDGEFKTLRVDQDAAVLICAAMSRHSENLLRKDEESL